MKLLLCLGLVFSSTLLGAAPYDGWRCSAQLGLVAREWRAQQKWEKHAIGVQGEAFWASETDQFGTWVVVRQSKQGEAIARLSQAGRLEIAYEGANCQRKVLGPFVEKLDGRFYTDLDLAKLVRAHPRGALYVWSPRMGLAQDGIAEIRRAAKSLNLPVQILLAKDVPRGEVEELRRLLGSDAVRQVDSLEFKLRNVDQHYPALLVYRDGRILPGVKYGHEKAARYQLDLERLLRQ